MKRSFFKLAILRLMRTVYYPVMLVIFAVGIIAVSYCGEEEALPVAGVYDADRTELSRSVVKTLCENGFCELHDEQSLRQGIGDGDFNCGAVIVSGFGDSLQNGVTEGVVNFIYSPASFVPELYQNHVIAAVYKEYAPYITINSLTGTDISGEEVLTSYEDIMAKGLLFSFDIEEAETSSIGGERSLSYTVFTSSFLIFVTVMYSSCRFIDDGIASRIGAGDDMRCVRIPGITVNVLSVIAASAVSCLIFRILGKTAEAGLFFPMCAYILLLTAFGITAASVFFKSGHVQILSFFIILASLLLCPLYFDIAAVIPAAGQIRMFLPVYWLWMCVEKPGTAFLISAVALPVSATAFYCRLRSIVNKNGKIPL